MASFTVNQRKKTITVYNKSINDEEYKTVERYKTLGYDVKMLEKRKPVRTDKHVKDDMVKYLEGNIDDDLYLEFIDRVDKRHNFLKIKWWLTNELKKRAEEKNKRFEPIEDIVNKAKSIEEKERQKENKGNVNENKSKLNEE